MQTKKFWLSKTFWLNLLVLLCGFVPAAREWIARNPVTFSSAWGALNILLRFATSGKIGLNDEPAQPSGNAWTLLGLLVPAVMACGLLASCNSPIPLGGTVQYKGISLSGSSKGGLWMAADLDRMLEKTRKVDTKSGK